MESSNPKIIEQLLQATQYSLPQAEKAALLTEELRALTEYHRARCAPYNQIVEGLRHISRVPPASVEEVPFLPVRLFKTLKLQSIGDTEILKVLASSGTTSQQVSRITLDRGTSLLQTRALASIITSFIGPKRLPMIIVDSSAILKDRTSMSARGAGLVGLSNFGRDHFYALDAEMRLDMAGLHHFLARHPDESILIFGFTFMVWQYFYQQLVASGQKLQIDRGILIHSGGWKKLQDQAVTNAVFKASIQEQTGISRIHNFYGMVEQVGGIFMECEACFFHAPNVADIIIRNPQDWSVLPAGKRGVIETLSVLPRSYPGHSLLTEDVGVIQGWDDCPCGRKGVRFKVEGRMSRAELRGCSDTHAFNRPLSEATGGLRQFLPERKSATEIEELCSPEFFRRDPFPPFDPLALELLDNVSAEILKVPGIKELPELSALAFWLRKANLTSIIAAFQRTVPSSELVQPVGVAFHVAPSNVDTIFLYSWALALLAGNLNVVRVSQSVTPQLDLLLGVLSRVLSDDRFKPIRLRNILLTYPHDERISGYLSKSADARLVWGGDGTVNALRSLPAKATTREISFADKVSLCAIDSARYLEATEDARTGCARNFYNDAYPFDQLACSSPHFVVFIGAQNETNGASEVFWSALTRELRRRGRTELDSTQMDKLVAASEMIGTDPDARWKSGWQSGAPVVLRIPLASIPDCRVRHAGGFFVEVIAPQLTDLGRVLQAGDQTLSYFGFAPNEMREAARFLSLRGIDRIVPIGQALNFAPVWDGYVLLAELTRRVTVL